MPSARDPFTSVQSSPNLVQSLVIQFIFIHQNSPEFISTAEVIAAVNPLRCAKSQLQCVNAEASNSGVAMRNDFSEVLVVTYETKEFARDTKGSEPPAHIVSEGIIDAQPSSCPQGAEGYGVDPVP